MTAEISKHPADPYASEKALFTITAQNMAPIPSTSNTMVVDEVRMYNGSAERYNWKLMSKKEKYIPYNNFHLEPKDVGANKYANLLKPGHENPDFVRWELHRVYVLEGKLNYIMIDKPVADCANPEYYSNDNMKAAGY